MRVGARRKTFIVILNGGRRIKLGNYPLTSLKDARREAYRRLSDPSDQAVALEAPTAAEVVRSFIHIHHAQSRPRTRKEQERLLTKHFLSGYKDVPLNRIRTSDIVAVTDALKELPSEQLHAYRALKTLFTWARKRHVIETSPLEDLGRPNEPVDRERVLNDRELVAIYRAAKKLGYPFGHIILICIHTGMRRGEVGALKRSYVTAEAIRLPREITKNDRQHVVPNLIGAELASIPSVGNSDYFFPTTVGGPFCSFGKNKVKFDKLCGVSNWTLHNTRRTVRTKLAEWGCCDDATAERILGHVTAESRISRIYNRWRHFPQMKAALEKYEERLADLLAPS